MSFDMQEIHAVEDVKIRKDGEKNEKKNWEFNILVVFNSPKLLSAVLRYAIT